MNDMMRVYRDITSDGVSYQVYIGNESHGPFLADDVELEQLKKDNDFIDEAIVTCDWRESE